MWVFKDNDSGVCKWTWSELRDLWGAVLQNNGISANRLNYYYPYNNLKCHFKSKMWFKYNEQVAYERKRQKLKKEGVLNVWNIVKELFKLILKLLLCTHLYGVLYLYAVSFSQRRKRIHLEQLTVYSDICMSTSNKDTKYHSIVISDWIHTIFLLEKQAEFSNLDVPLSSFNNKL